MFDAMNLGPRWGPRTPEEYRECGTRWLRIRNVKEEIMETHLLDCPLDGRVWTLGLFEELQNLLQALFCGLPHNTASVRHCGRHRRSCWSDDWLPILDHVHIVNWTRSLNSPESRHGTPMQAESPYKMQVEANTNGHRSAKDGRVFGVAVWCSFPNELASLRGKIQNMLFFSHWDV